MSRKMAAVTAPHRTAAQHQSLLHFVGQSPWSDERVLAKVGKMVLLGIERRQRARMPMPPEVGAAVVAYLRDGRPTSSCRRLFLRMLAPHVGLASGCAITMIAC